MRIRTIAFLLVIVGFTAEPLAAQSLDLTIGDTGLSIGDSRRVNGLRLNFRDRRMRQVNGINATIWTPHNPARGTVNGIALGLPVTGARRIYGLATGILGAGADEELIGIGIAPLGVGGGGRVEGIVVGGLGAGAGEDFVGIGLGGLGIGAGQNFKGIGVGGLGLGAGGDFTGFGLGGLGVGAGGNVKGLVIGGLGAGAGESVTGVGIGGLGIGAGGDVTGLLVGGLGVGAGGTLRGLAIGGVGAGAPAVVGVVLAGVGAGAEDFVGLAVAPAYFRIGEDKLGVGDGGRFTGVSISVFNRIRGAQNGLTIGILNYTWRLNGLQLGLLNIARANPRGRRVLPVVNWNFE